MNDLTYEAVESENNISNRIAWYFEISLLELVSFVPIAITAGNILPSIGPIKIHWIYMGLVFLNSLIVLVRRKSTHGLFILIFLFALIQVVTSIKFSITSFIDFVAGPLLFIAIVNIVISDSISLHLLKRYRKKMLVILSIPILIALLQFIHLLPLEFMNARYVNVTEYGSEKLERVNGFLHHGIELAVISFFLFSTLAMFTTSLRAYFFLVFMIAFGFVIIIKSGIISAILFLGFYGYFIDKRLRALKVSLIALAVILGFSYLFILIPDLEADRFSFNWQHFKFDDQLFTGRGFIWNIYFLGIKHFNIFQILFGAGYGSPPEVFKLGMSGENLANGWSPGTHNQLLELFVNGGLLAIWLIVTILVKQYRKLSLYFQERKLFFRLCYVGVISISVLGMGLTAPIMSMFVFWCGLSALIISFKVKTANSK